MCAANVPSRPGKPYPTIQLDRIQDRLADMSRDIAAAVGSPLP